MTEAPGPIPKVGRVGSKAIGLRPMLILVMALSTGGAAAQETPRPNRLAWFEGFPEPLPEGVSEVAFESSSQFLRPDLEQSPDGRTTARLDGEGWQLTADLARALGPGRINLRIRLEDRSGGIADRAIQNWHRLFGMDEGGREKAPNRRLAYHLERDGVLVGDLSRPGLRLMDVDVAWVHPFGTPESGGRWGASIQLPTGHLDDFSGSGSTDVLLGGALWRRWGSWRASGQLERVYLGLPTHSPLKAVLAKRAFGRAWASFGWVGTGAGFLPGMGVEVALGYAESPYRTGISRIDQPGLQQHWTFRHAHLPRWRFGISEEAGTYTAPDITAFVAYRL